MPDYADSNRVAVRYVEETVFASTPAGASFQEVNMTSESLKSNINTVTSNTIRSDRNVSDITQVGGGAGGDIAFELRYNDIEPLIAGALQSVWATTAVSTATASARVSAAVVQADSSVLNDVVVGRFFRLRNATTPANNGDYRVTAVSTTGAVTRVYLADASSGAAAAFTSEVFGASTAFGGRTIRNGITKKSFTLEKEFTDVGSAFHQYPGMRVTALSLNFETQNILTGSLGFTGVGQNIASATIASATVSPGTNSVMNASDNVGRVWEGGQAVGGICFQSLSIDLNNNPRDQACVGSRNLQGIGTGKCTITGNISAYFVNNNLIEKFTEGTKSNFRFQIDDADGNSYIVDLPRITYTDFTIAAGGGDQDVIQDGTWGASIDAGGAYTIQIDALDA